MSTRANIIALSKGEYKKIYLHSDGYPEHTLKTLTEHYSTQESVDKLMELGDLSTLSASPETTEGHSFDHRVKGYCVAYGRDRGEENVEARSYKALQAALNSPPDDGVEYIYYWDASGIWAQLNAD